MTLVHVCWTAVTVEALAVACVFARFGLAVRRAALDGERQGRAEPDRLGSALSPQEYRRELKRRIRLEQARADFEDGLREGHQIGEAVRRSPVGRAIGWTILASLVACPWSGPVALAVAASAVLLLLALLGLRATDGLERRALNADMPGDGPSYERRRGQP